MGGRGADADAGDVGATRAQGDDAHGDRVRHTCVPVRRGRVHGDVAGETGAHRGQGYVGGERSDPLRTRRLLRHGAGVVPSKRPAPGGARDAQGP